MSLLGTFAGQLGRITSHSYTGNTYNVYIVRYGTVQNDKTECEII